MSFKFTGDLFKVINVVYNSELDFYKKLEEMIKQNNLKLDSNSFKYLEKLKNLNESDKIHFITYFYSYLQ